MKPYINFYLTELLKWEMFQDAQVVEQTETHIFMFRKIVPFKR